MTLGYTSNKVYTTEEYEVSLLGNPLCFHHLIIETISFVIKCGGVNHSALKYMTFRILSIKRSCDE